VLNTVFSKELSLEVPLPGESLPSEPTLSLELPLPLDSLSSELEHLERDPGADTSAAASVSHAEAFLLLSMEAAGLVLLVAKELGELKWFTVV